MEELHRRKIAYLQRRPGGLILEYQQRTPRASREQELPARGKSPLGGQFGLSQSVCSVFPPKKTGFPLSCPCGFPRAHSGILDCQDLQPEPGHPVVCAAIKGGSGSLIEILCFGATPGKDFVL